MTVIDPVFDFSRAEPVIEDVVVRTEVGDLWVDVIVTPSGRKAIWAWSPDFTAEEAREWLKSLE